MATLEQLITPVTPAQAEATILGILQLVGFPATSWQDGSFPKTVVKMFAEVYSDVTEVVAVVTRGGFNDLAEGPWLDLYSESQYDNERQAGQQTEGLILLTDTGGGPYTISVSQLIVQTASGLSYRNQSQFADVDLDEPTVGILPLNGTLALTVQAETPGDEYNVANGTITVLATPLPGVTVSNPDPGSGSWITLVGADEEKDPELRLRNKTKWATLGTGASKDAYISWALTGAPTVTRVQVDNANPDGPGTVRVYLANSAGGATAQEVTDANAFIQARRAVTATVTVLAATNVPITIDATVTVRTAFSAAYLASFTTLLTDFSQTNEIGTDVFLAALIELLMIPSGAVNAVITSPVGDTVINAGEVATFTVGTIALVVVP